MSFTLLSAFMLVTLLWSCKKDEQKVVFENGTAPVLSSTTAAVIPLSFTGAANEAVNLSWTNPNYQFNTGLSSYDVSYQVEIDTTGANFTNPNKKVIAFSKDLGLSVSQITFNDLLLNQLQLAPSMPHAIEIRVKSFLINSTGIQYSNVLKFTATPYSLPPKITPPVSGTLYITGSAVPSGWVNTPPPTQQFTMVSPTDFVLNSVAITGGNSYTFLSNFNSWDYKYSIAVKNDPTAVNGGDFQWQGNDILAPAVSGNYKIEVDFQRGKFTLTKL